MARFRASGPESGTVRPRLRLRLEPGLDEAPDDVRDLDDEQDVQEKVEAAKVNSHILCVFACLSGPGYGLVLRWSGGTGCALDRRAGGGHDVAADRGPATVLRCILHGRDLGLDPFNGLPAEATGSAGRASRRPRRRHGRSAGSSAVGTSRR